MSLFILVLKYSYVACNSVGVGEDGHYLYTTPLKVVNRIEIYSLTLFTQSVAYCYFKKIIGIIFNNLFLYILMISLVLFLS